jgi:hypothetical protein
MLLKHTLRAEPSICEEPGGALTLPQHSARQGAGGGPRRTAAGGAPAPARPAPARGATERRSTGTERSGGESETDERPRARRGRALATRPDSRRCEIVTRPRPVPVRGPGLVRPAAAGPHGGSGCRPARPAGPCRRRPRACRGRAAAAQCGCCPVRAPPDVSLLHVTVRRPGVASLPACRVAARRPVAGGQVRPGHRTGPASGAELNRARSQ